MIRVKILGTIYDLPTKPNEITFEEFISINTCVGESDSLSFDSKLSILALLMKCSVDTLSLIEEAQIEVLYNSLNYLRNDLSLSDITYVKIGKEHYHFVDFSKLTVQEYLDIDFLIKEVDVIYENLDKILASCLRKQISKNILINNCSRNCILEEYDESKVEKYAELVFNNFNAETTIVLLNKLLKYRTEITQTYKLIFCAPSQSESDEVSEESVMQVNEIWGFYHTLSSICDDDKQKIDYWMGRPVKELFTHLSYIKQVNLENQKK